MRSELPDLSVDPDSLVQNFHSNTTCSSRLRVVSPSYASVLSERAEHHDVSLASLGMLVEGGRGAPSAQRREHVMLERDMELELVVLVDVELAVSR